MSIHALVKTAEKLAVDNAPTLMSAFAVTGTLTAVALSAKATIKADAILLEAQADQDLQELGHTLTRKEKIKLVWPQYIPTALAVTATIGFIVTANSISSTRLAGMVTAYKLTEKHFDEYKDKIVEKLGLKDEAEIRHEINQDSVDRSDPSEYAMSSFGSEDGAPNGTVLFREFWTGRYFHSTMAKVQGAVNDINYRMMHDRYATLSDFYDLIGLSQTQMSGEIGWCIENPIELTFDVVLADNGSVPCAVMEYSNKPQFQRNYDRAPY